MRAMKDSGIEWIGEIPEEWKITKMKYLGEYINGYAFKPNDWSSNGKPIIRIQDLTGTNNNPNFYEGTLDEKYLVKNGDILVSWAATLDAFVWQGSDSWLNQHIFKAKENNKLIKRRYFYWLIKESMKNMNNGNKHGIVMQHATQGLFDNFEVPLPPKYYQINGGEYLDKKCSKLDSIIAKEQEVITKLQEYKLSLITEKVTKGLNPNVEMKDSGIVWIGQIPKHWCKIRLRYIGSLQNGISKGGNFFGHGYPFISYGDVYKNFVLPKVVSGLVETTEEERKNYSVKKGDIFFTRTSETIEEVGLSCVCENTIENATFAGFVIRVRPKDETLNTNFAKYYFRSNHHRFFLVKEMNLVTRASLSQNLLKNMIVLLPPLEEQQAIASYLDTKCAAIDAAIAKKQALIEKFTEYKKSLIYEVVTGKKEV